MQKRQNNIKYQKNYGKITAKSVAMIKKQPIRINYTKEISIKNDAKKKEYYQIFKKLQ